MDFMLKINVNKPEVPIQYADKIFMIGSCFTEHIGNALEELKFSVLQNPNGILFDPASVCKSLISYVHNKQYKESDLFQLNEVWHSWNHHSRFSNVHKSECLHAINSSQIQAHEFLKKADWLIITLGSAFSYRLTTETGKQRVANCHRAPTQWFNKELMEIEEIVSELDKSLQLLLGFNPKLKVIFTVSPVRHIRDGVVDNNRSKARLIESVHTIVKKYRPVHYFPAYEIVIDVLRDYRFYDADLVHPNYMATEFVLEKFSESYIAEETRQLMEEVRKIVIAARHKAFQPSTQAHIQFLQAHLEKAKALATQYPYLDLEKEIKYFSVP
jgi:hypothetical protein